MEFKNKSLLLFDLDGTLVDSAPDLANALNHALQHLKLSTFNETQVRQWIGNGTERLVERAIEAQGFDTNTEEFTALTNRALTIYKDFYAKNLCVATRLYPGVFESLPHLREREYKMAVVTNKPTAFIAPILSGLSIDQFFCCIVGAGSVDELKPDPAPLLHAVTTLGSSPMATVMVGDSKNDIIAAKRAGIGNVGVTYGYNYNEPIAASDPDLCVDHFADLLGALP